MDNRFGIRDVVMAALLLAILVSIWLAMKQYDRQWDEMRSLRSDLQTLTNTQNRMAGQVADLQRDVRSGAAALPRPTPGTPGATDSNATDVTADDVTSVAAGVAPDSHALDGVRAARDHTDFAEGDVMVDAFGTQLKSITALTYKDAYGRRIQSFVLEGLASQDEDTLEWEPLIAESWDVRDNSEAYHAWLTARTAELKAKLDADATVADATRQSIVDEMTKASAPVPAPGTPEDEALTQKARDAWLQQQLLADPARPPAMTIVFKLRRDVTFSDGKPLTAHDAEYTWTLLNNPRLDAPETRNFYDNVVGYKALDDYTLEFTFREPHYLAFSMVAAFPILPRHFFEVIEVDELNRHPGLLLGSGPYRLEDPKGWGPGKLMKLVRNENYWGPKPGILAHVWLEIEQDVPRLTAFKNGQIDIFGATPEQYVDLKKDPAVTDKYEPFEYQAIPSGYQFIAWNTRRNNAPTKFADARVRRAMTMLIDRQRIADEVLLGLAAPTSGPFDDASKQADPDIKPHPFDPQQALSLLAECGWKPGPDGVLRNSAGQPFAFTLTYPSGNDVYERVMLMVKDTLNRYGVLMTQDPQEWSVFIERVDGRAFDACALAWGGGAIEGDIRQMFHSSQIAGGANNFTSYSNPKLDALIDEARRTVIEDERMPLWQACHRILHEDQPYTFLIRRKALLFIDRRFHNVQRVTTGLNERVEWYVPGPMQTRRP